MTNLELANLLQGMADDAGDIQPQRVVDQARRSDHPLHGEFEWDDSIAGEKYRLDQARKIIRSAQLVVSPPNRVVIQKVPAFIIDPSPANRPNYIPFAKVKADRDKAREVVVSEFKRAIQAMERAKKLSSALLIESDVDEEITRLSALLKRASVNDQAQGSA